VQQLLAVLWIFVLALEEFFSGDVMASPKSKARLESRIKERVAHCLEFEVNDPRATFITLTRVELSNDLGLARVFYTVLGKQGDRTQVEHMLESAKGFVRKQLGRVIQVRRMPALAFEYDLAVEDALRIDNAIQAALRHDREVNSSAHEDRFGKADKLVEADATETADPQDDQAQAGTPEEAPE
jgi:ribosome-binding factor A